MRVLQLIDSLRSGGAERMAINYANAFAKDIDASFLCCTRAEGFLTTEISPHVGYLFLKKKNTLDLRAFLKLRSFAQKNKIDLVQAHSSSWFFALMLKFSLPNLKLVWHDHYGKELNKRNTGVLKFVSGFFDGIISVNSELKVWADNRLDHPNVVCLNNFISFENRIQEASRNLNNDDKFKIVCLANLRPQKDHLTLLEAFQKVVEKHPDTTLGLIGKTLSEKYTEKVKNYAIHLGIQEKIVFYGERQDVQELLKVADLGVLSSTSEGLPLAILEYGRAGLPVVCTETGDCLKVLGRNGLLVPTRNAIALAEAINFYIEHQLEREINAMRLHDKIKTEYSEKKVLNDVSIFYQKIMEK